jgi:hypothetical protein
VELLQAVSEHRTILLVEDVLSDLHNEVWPNAENGSIEGRVVDLAQCETIGDARLTEWIAVLDDVSRVEEFAMTKPAHRTAIPIGSKHALPKTALVETLLGGHRDVSATPDVGVFLHACLVRLKSASLIHADRESQRTRVVAHDKDGICRLVQAGNEPEEIDKGHLRLHRLPQPNVVGMHRVGSAIPVANQAIATNLIVVWSRLSLLAGSGRDAQRDLRQYGRLENALGAKKGHATTLMNKSRLELTPPKRRS